MQATETLRLYRAMLKAGKQFQSYNFRDYAVRSVKLRFRQNMALTDAREITTAMHDGRQNLELIKRQAAGVCISLCARYTPCQFTSRLLPWQFRISSRRPIIAWMVQRTMCQRAVGSQGIHLGIIEGQHDALVVGSIE